MDKEGNKQIISKTKSKTMWLSKLVKTIMWTLLAVAFLVVGLLQATISVLTPERLTPLTEKYLSKSLNADVTVKRVELTVWETFPDVTLEIDSLSMKSRALQGLNDSIRAKLPANADSLLSLKYFHGGIKLYALMAGEISLYDIELREPMVNLVKVDSTLANYDIVPPSAPDTIPDTTQTKLPKIIIDHFAILDAKPIRYFSLSDSIDVTLNLRNVSFNGVGAPKYMIDFQGNVASPLLALINREKSEFIINGGVEWSQSTPKLLALNDFTLGFDIMKSHINGEFDFGEEMSINKLSLELEPLKYNDVVERLPKEYSLLVEGIVTDASLRIDVELTRPFVLSKDTIPSADVNVKIPNCKFNYGKLKVDKFSANLNASLKGNNLDDAVINIKKVALKGMGVDCSFSSTISSIISDPLIDGEFNGRVNLSHLPPFVAKLIAGKVSGEINANTIFNLRQSYLNRNNFHRILVKGGVGLTNFRFNSSDSLTNVYLRKAEFALGTNESFVRDTHRADSLLTASVKIDTCAFFQDGYDVRFAELKAGIGCTNQQQTLDTTHVNPIGGTISLRRLNFMSQEDSMKVRLRDVKCLSVLRRFKSMEKVPELVLKIDAGRVGASTKEMRVSLRESSINVTAHLKPRRKMSPQVKSAYDKIIKENPTLSNDSAYAMARRQVRTDRNARNARRDSVAAEISTIDFGVDRSTRALLYRWDVKGSIKAKRARLFTPYFPLRNRLTDVDIDFTTDSVAFNRIGYKVGRSDFKITGAISNIKRALSGRHGQPLKMTFMMRSDTIDVNQLAEAVFAGAAYSESAATTSMLDLGDEENEDMLEEAIEQRSETAQAGALLVPMNIDALMRVTAKNVIYSDMLMHNMSGNVQIYRGSLRFDQLRATTDMGSVNLSALYSAPTKKDMNFGFGLQIKDFYIDRFLDFVPAVDSIMPLMRDIKGIINADIAATVDVDTAMNLVIPSLNAAIKIAGDSLVLMDAETFRTVSKWLLFKDKQKNMIDNMTVEVLVKNSQLELFPFMFNIDRYKLGVLGYNDLAMNFNYHVSVLKSPIPFKFGINVSGNPDKMKVRLGRAKFKENMVAERVAIVDTTRVNLLRQIEGVFRRGIDRSSRLNLLDTGQSVGRFDNNEQGDTISHADSLLFIQEGVLPAPPTPPATSPTETTTDKKNKKKKK